MCSHLLTLFSGGAWVVNLQHESMWLNLPNTECAMWHFIYFLVCVCVSSKLNNGNTV